jgi:hypothetical protein
MPDIPRAVLSEHIEEHMDGRRLLAAVFLTFEFDPGFFELEILPLLLDIPVSHADAVRRLQLEDALRSVPQGITVFYDQNGLRQNTGPAKLDIRRIPVRHRTGVFHPKNIFALVEADEPDQDGYHARSLLVSCLSANLTQTGWWQNVEVCHTEVIEEGDSSRLKDDLHHFIERLEARTAAWSADGHAALREIRGFLRGTEQRSRRSSGGLLHTHFFGGHGSVPDFLEDVAGKTLRGMNLEIISPFFDRDGGSRPLLELIDRFRPPEVRLLLPRDESGGALCDKRFFDFVRAMPGVEWGRLPEGLLRRGKRDEASLRSVHAKVYRFFTTHPRRELLFVGSPNLTSAAFFNGGNFETGFLVQLEPPRKPEWWLGVDGSRPRQYMPQEVEDGEAAAEGGTRLSLRYWWDTGKAEAFWDAGEASPSLRVESCGIPIMDLSDLPSRTWTPLSATATEKLCEMLRSTSIFAVIGDGPNPGLVLVQEENMSHRPSLLFDLTPAEILRYWSLLTVEQRAAFIDARAPQLSMTTEGAALVSQFRKSVDRDTLFDRFAGIFHAFGCLHRSIRQALDEGRDRDATYRLFGQKYDSLGCLLERIAKDRSEGTGELVEQYVIGLCALQLVRDLRPAYPDFWGAHRDDDRRLAERLSPVTGLRVQIEENNGGTMHEFLDWFEPWFLKRAEPVSAEAE